MALLPFFAIKCNTVEKDNNNSNIENNKINSDDILCGFVAGLYKENYCDETLKALAILVKSNYSVLPDKFDINSDVFVAKENASGYLKDNYQKIEKTVNSTEELLFHNEKIKYIPYSTISNGTTAESDDYDYLCAVASTWDCFSKNYDKDSVCVGVSIEGVDYLCRNGASAQEALLWYLPNFEIRKQ